MDLGLTGKVALVLGGGGGLGSAIATTLATEGARIAVADISERALEPVSRQLADIGTGSLALRRDLSNLDDIDSHVAAIEARLGPVDVLISITGGPPPTPVAGQPQRLWSAQGAMAIRPNTPTPSPFSPARAPHTSPVLCCASTAG